MKTYEEVKISFGIHPDQFWRMTKVLDAGLIAYIDYTKVPMAEAYWFSCLMDDPNFEFLLASAQFEAYELEWIQKRLNAYLGYRSIVVLFWPESTDDDQGIAGSHS